MGSIRIDNRSAATPLTQKERKMAFNWTAIGNTMSGITSALTAAGVSSTSFPSILNAIGLSSNPNESVEVALCGQILQATGNPILQAALAMKLATEQGIPASAATLAMTLGTAGVDVPSRVLQIEQIIKSGS